MSECLRYYYNQAQIDLPEKVVDYLLSRGLSREEVSFYGIRYFDRDLEFKDLSRSDYPQFKKYATKNNLLKNKLVFPLWNSQEQLVGFIFQNLGKFKTKFFSILSEYEGVFFGLKQALPFIWKEEEVFITEGVFDFFPLYRLFPNSLGILTANISSKQITFFKRYVKRVFSLLDNDEAGKFGFVKLQEKLRGAVEVIKIPFLAKDLGELWEKHGEENFQKVIKDQINQLILL